MKPGVAPASLQELVPPGCATPRTPPRENGASLDSHAPGKKISGLRGKGQVVERYSHPGAAGRQLPGLCPNPSRKPTVPSRIAGGREPVAFRVVSKLRLSRESEEMSCSLFKAGYEIKIPPHVEREDRVEAAPRPAGKG